MSTRKIRVAITHGDINGIGYEVVLKIFEDERILELFTPILYGSSHIANFWKAHLGLEHVSWQVIRQASEAKDGVLNILDCTTGREQVEIGQPTDAAGRAAFEALERATADIRMGLCDVLVTAPINKAVMPRDLFPFNGHTDYLEAIAARTPGESLMVLASGDCRVALATTHIPVSAIASRLSSELILRKLRLLSPCSYLAPFPLHPHPPTSPYPPPPATLLHFPPPLPLLLSSLGSPSVSFALPPSLSLYTKPHLPKRALQG